MTKYRVEQWGNYYCLQFLSKNDYYRKTTKKSWWNIFIHFMGFKSKEECENIGPQWLFIPKNGSYLDEPRCPLNLWMVENPSINYWATDNLTEAENVFMRFKESYPDIQSYFDCKNQPEMERKQRINNLNERLGA